MKKLLISAAIVAGAAFGMNGQANAACGEFQMSDMNWPSATLMANVDKIILEEGYGCSIELIPGATTATFATMNEKGEPHVAAELWTNAVSVELEKAVGEGRLHSAVRGPITELGEGWYAHNEPESEIDRLQKELSESNPQLAEALEKMTPGFAKKMLGELGCDDGPPSLMEKKV